MIRRLQELASQGQPVRVGLVGAGSMGRGVALQLRHTPGMHLAWIADHDARAAASAARLAGECPTASDPRELLESAPVDVFVEATNSIGPAAEYGLAALDHGAHVVLMNAEVDLALGPLLKAEGDRRNLIVTSDAGDQHGVLATMIDEILLWGFDLVQAGNIKGFLDPAATPASIAGEAAKRRLSATQCCAYTDGTKLHIEMAVLANGFGLLPPAGGMTGPRAARVEEALTLFDFDSYGGAPRIDYLLGAEPGGGVYVVATPRAGFPDEQRFLLNYYKLGGGPHYLFYRPYHLCHLETPRAIAAAALDGRAVLQAGAGRVCDVYAHAKRDLKAGESITHAIGSAECYGRVHPAADADGQGLVPIVVLEEPARLARDVPRDAPLRHDALALPESSLLALRRKQDALS
ncbi:MAG: homoserine dehydrogenase [Akkermansiaceae bacterium]|nr:homoserine dehydrogenase [Akkermansiaceae bacterium]